MLIDFRIQMIYSSLKPGTTYFLAHTTGRSKSRNTCKTLLYTVVYLPVDFKINNATFLSQNNYIQDQKKVRQHLRQVIQV